MHSQTLFVLSLFLNPQILNGAISLVLDVVGRVLDVVAQVLLP